MIPTDESDIIPNWSTGSELQSPEVDRNCSSSPFATDKARTITGRLNFFTTRHVPYWESDHVLNFAYNVLTGGTCLEDIERLRNDETYMNALDAERIPDPTTAGDFLRRFEDETRIFGAENT